MADEIVCRDCGYVGEPATVTKGSFGVELALWVCLIVPGLIYSVWRVSSRHDACPRCGNAHLIPRDSPLAQKFVRENLPDVPAPAVRPPSKAARSVGHALGQFVGRLVGRKARR